ncbi:PREDICTED: uncharacterized protein LOC108360631 [Rhagoletis zephyria]|uniref:uncharacterized protein LOC108360631 n=1 Tax=Rhagoletis zephyria TaxID=28612 RepID=UPI0008119305|nr:PREDICTED: uncharacterized protein LOC108360631 [Rhagoletis zephyria]
MYRQVLIHPKDRSLQCILWRDAKDELPKEYNLKTVTYGTSAAPFLAIRTLHQVANDYDAPLAAKAIKQHFYVDDFMACAINARLAIELKNELCTILSKGGFHLRKWASNSGTFMQSIETRDRELNSETIIDTSQAIKTLGLLWDTSRDCFKYSVNLPIIEQTVTKRAVLSDIAKIFDPIGWLSPVVNAMKIFMQKLWLRGLGWDDELPNDLYNKWTEYRQNINDIQKLRIPRWLEFADETSVELHGFADSSEQAYSAAIYMRIPYAKDAFRTNLIAAKTKVAPVKQVSLPRLELCAAHLMTKLMTKVRSALNLLDAAVVRWTDSTVVLAWLSDHPRRWKTFVANRTAQILEVIPAEQWRHISSQKNPADLATRGIRPNELINNQLWWHGPNELRQLVTTCDHTPSVPEDTDLEERKETMSHEATVEEIDIFDRYSSYTNLLRVTALLLRFTDNCKAMKSKLEMSKSFLTTNELLRAHNALVRKAQTASYAPEIRSLRQGKQLLVSHKLAMLSPFIDGNDVLRVGGRITNADVNYDQKHPIILNKDHQLTKLIINDYHVRNLHAGNRQLLYLLGIRYWIPRGTIAIKRCIYKCTVCMRQRGIPHQQQMGTIPRPRLNPGSAFLNTGVDFAGPIQIRSLKGRGSRLYKCWIALFVCLATKAVHIELVTEQSTAAFIAALRRFIARRGKPMHIYSDNGTNFVGADQQLREIHQLLHSPTTQDGITRELADQHIQWHFSPPSGPHFGGIWEAGVKSMKHHLKRTLADTSVTYEELQTVLCQIEFCLNSRPLCIKSSRAILTH